MGQDERTPEWVFQDGDKPAGRELLLQRMQKHIETAAGRYRGKVISWDVVNEALDDGTNFIRPSKWFSTLGEEFLVKAFQFARQADPDAVLFTTTTMSSSRPKRAKLLRLVRLLQEKKAPIQAVGIQGHYELDTVPYQDLEDTISAIHSLGVKVMMTEFDLDAIPRAKWWADGGKFARRWPSSIPMRMAVRQMCCNGRPSSTASSSASSAATPMRSRASPSGTCTTGEVG